MKRKFKVIASKNNQPRRVIRAAEDVEDTRVKDLMDALKDDFDYALEGFDKMARDGQVSEALNIMTALHQALNEAIQESASQISQ